MVQKQSIVHDAWLMVLLTIVRKQFWRKGNGSTLVELLGSLWWKLEAHS